MTETAQSTVNQRVFDVYYALKNRTRVRNKTEFAKGVGFLNTHWSEFESGKRKFSASHLLSLVNQFREVSLAFLETGEGEMFSQAPFDVQALGFLSDMPSVELPFISFKARASFIGLGGAAVDPSQFETVRLSLLTPEEAERYTGAVVFEVDGDSMEPLMHSGQRVIAWPVPESKWEQLHNVACVVSYDDTVTVKAIRENDLFTKNLLTLYALDARAGYLPVARQSIRSIWRADEFFDRPKIRL
ncbi:S24 family peptidase [Hymenobacter negativus]|uniref:Peptidase S24/S26A/S26B/S26C domain-containing protein n=1 Tax=Hymenobacter negativus TaxID=2795026 RepID=A0ABS0Q9U0_9BACT|nr:hypothetical protein [Hymenobacter negativus]MBH8558969.1 hypothetical protein [Hymenobacter negativus]